MGLPATLGIADLIGEDHVQPSGRAAQIPLTLDLVRPLQEADLQAIIEATPPEGELSILEIKHAHHQLAMLIAQGQKLHAISLQTGYSPSYISTIRRAPAMMELVAHYLKQDEIVHADVMLRVRNLGIAGVEELQKRIDQEPEKWTRRELMELMDMGLIQPIVAAQQAKGQAAAGGGTNITVSFVKAPERVDSGPIIEATLAEDLDDV